MEHRSEFSTFDVVKILDIKRERLREWMIQGFVKPAVSASGAGSKAEFDLLGLYKLGIFKRLVDTGMNRRIAAAWISTNSPLNDIVEAEKINMIVSLSRKNSGGRWICYFEPPWEISEDELKEDWDLGLIINFTKVREEIKNGIKKL